MQWVEFVYYAKKAFALYPGVGAPISAPVFRAHYAARRAARSLPRALLDAAVGLGFHAWVPWRAARVQRRFGLDDAWRRRALAIAHRRFVDPNDLALFRIERADQLDDYIRRFEDAAFNKIINPHGWTPACVLADKVRFYARCAAHALPHPTVYAVFRQGRCEHFTPPAGTSLILKPSHGEGGRGVTRLPASLSTLDSAATLYAALRPHLQGQERAWLVQQSLDNHAALTPYALDAVSTARITTLRDERGAPEVVSAVLRVASRRDVAIDNMKAGGLILPIDLHDGRPGVACHGYGGGDYTHHPVTGAAFDALVLPDWTEAKALVAAAHDTAFPEYVLIGWDVAFTPGGPVIVEGNAKPGVLMPQRASRRGLAGQRYGELLALHLARLGDAPGAQ